MITTKLLLVKQQLIATIGAVQDNDEGFIILWYRAVADKVAIKICVFVL